MRTLDEHTFPQFRNKGAGRPNWLVMKFGGTSVSSADRWATIAALANERLEHGFRPVIVHSALATVSNRLEIIIEAASDGDYHQHLREIRLLHLDLAAELGLDGEVLTRVFFNDLEDLLGTVQEAGHADPNTYARIMATGELLATSIGAAYLQKQGHDVSWVDAREVLRSIPTPGENERTAFLAASCVSGTDEGVQDLFHQKGGLIVTQGFIASNQNGECVLLGRGGSDTSAAYFAAKLQAAGLEIWTDVPGLFSADPRVVSGARLLHVLSYGEAQEIASTGGAVLHPSCLRPAREQGIDIRVRCTHQPELAGTLISRDSALNTPGLKALSSRENITVISMETLGMWQKAGFLADAFKCFADLGLSIDLVSTAESNVTVTLDSGRDVIDEPTLSRLRESLENLCRVEIIENTEIVSLVGHKIRALLHEIGPSFEVFSEYRIHLVSQAANDLNLSFVVEEGQAHRLLKKLHASLVRPMANDVVFGPTWNELQLDRPAPEDSQVPWWSERQAELLEIASEQSAAYVYDLKTINTTCNRLAALKNIDRIYYAIKANSHPDVLRTIESTGLNFECVSPGEIERVLMLFPGIDRQRILFTPNFAPREDYEYALENDVLLTLDDLYPLREWGDIFRGKAVFLRLDTGLGHGHHEHVRTAGVHSKFGIPIFELEEAHELVAKNRLVVTGLHAHVGSGILQSDNWRNIAETLVDIAKSFPDVRVLDLGGGLGVPEKAGQHALNLPAIDQSLAAVKTQYGQYEFWLEPGRYIVAEAGVLLAKVTQTKGKGKVRYVGINTGMNSLIRPALYGAYHEIVNLSRFSEKEGYVTNIVGPICESGDKLGNDRLLPVCKEGDVLLIANVGAYGYVMASHYNLRTPAVEVAI